MNSVFPNSEEQRVRDRQYIREIMIAVHLEKLRKDQLVKACQDSIMILNEEHVDCEWQDNDLLVHRARLWLLEMLMSALLKTTMPLPDPELFSVINRDTEWTRVLPLFMQDLVQNPTPFLLQQSLIQCSCIDRGLSRLYPTALSFAEMIHDTLLE